MNDLQIFSNPDFGEIRTLQEGEKTLFCGSDIARALGYKRPNDAITAHCKGTVKRRTPTTSGEQEMNFIPEGDIYRLAAQSELPGADKFESWIFDEVLPSIRKTGSYAIKAKRSPLSSVNHAAEIIGRAYDSAKIEPSYKVIALTKLYQSEGLSLPEPPLTAEEPTYDLTAIAKELGVMSDASNGKIPHSHAVGAIVSALNIPQNLIIHAPFTNNGHSADYDRYKAPVLEQVSNWIADRNYPTLIGVGGGKTYKVTYRSAEGS